MDLLRVLILIVMEDALRAGVSLYPELEAVLILIVMEDALREMAKCNSFFLLSVLILIVMEDALRDEIR